MCGVVEATVTRVTPACVLPSITSRRPTIFLQFSVSKSHIEGLLDQGL